CRPRPDRPPLRRAPGSAGQRTDRLEAQSALALVSASHRLDRGRVARPDAAQATRLADPLGGGRRRDHDHRSERARLVRRSTLRAAGGARIRASRRRGVTCASWARDRLGTLAVRVSIRRSPASSVAARTIEWLPLVPATAYVLVVATKLPALVRALYWDSDAASAFVLGSFLRGHGTVEIPRFGWWTSMWWLLVTSELPWHTYLWQLTGFLFVLATAA